jgi:hypothetical protein
MAQKLKDGSIALGDYDAQAQVVRERTARLKALRLAKEAAEKTHEH